MTDLSIFNHDGAAIGDNVSREAKETTTGTKKDVICVTIELYRDRILDREHARILLRAMEMSDRAIEVALNLHNPVWPDDDQDHIGRSPLDHA